MKYTTAHAFRRALEDRLKLRAGGDGARLARERKRVVFDRILARLDHVAGGAWALKGGFALDLRLENRARSTKDIDLAWRDDGKELLDVLIDVAAQEVGDFFSFRIERINHPPEQFGGTQRFRVMASLAGRPFETFTLDIGPARDLVGNEILMTPDLLSFAGIEQIQVPAIPIIVHSAEKLHAYTRIYEGGRISTRTKDLVDLVLIAHLFSLDADALRRAIDDVFTQRATHDPPRAVPQPPKQWQVPFAELARTLGIDTKLTAGHGTVAALLDPILDRRIDAGSWNPQVQRWMGHTGF